MRADNSETMRQTTTTKVLTSSCSSFDQQQLTDRHDVLLMRKVKLMLMLKLQLGSAMFEF